MAEGNGKAYNGQNAFGSGFDVTEAGKLFREFKTKEKAIHVAKIEERRLERLANRGEGATFIGPPDPRKHWKPRPPMKR